MTFQNITNNSSSTTQANENFDAVAAAGTYGKRAPAVTGLTWAYYGGRGFGNTVADGTVALTASMTNYVVANRTTGAVSAATNTTNWNDTANYYRLYLIVTGAASITTATDYREFTGSGVAGSGMSNPMTTAGDLIYGGTPSGGIAPPTRLAATTNGYVLTLASGIPTWAAAPGGFSNPMTTAGDLILGGMAGAAGRLGIGGDGQVLTVSAGVVGWAASASGFANPMTTIGDLIVGGTSGTAGRLAAGTATYVLTSNGAGVAPTWQAPSGGGGLTGFTTSLNTSSPNNTVNASVIAASGGTTVQDVVISPKGGSGALIVGLAPDATATGGNKRGSNAVDLQSARSTATQVASGPGSILLCGHSNMASATDSAAGGTSATASAVDAFAYGNAVTASGASAVAFGQSSVANGANATALGSTGTTRTTANAIVIGAAGSFSLGARQVRILPLAGATTSATPTEITTDGATGTTTNRIILPNFGIFHVSLKLVATDLTDGASWQIEGLVLNVTGTTAAFIGTPTVTSLFASAGAATWTAALAISGLACLVNVTGQAAKNIKWTGMAFIPEATS